MFNTKRFLITLITTVILAASYMLISDNANTLLHSQNVAYADEEGNNQDNANESSEDDLQALVDKANKKDSDLTEEENNKFQILLKQQKIKSLGNGKYQLGDAAKADSSLWTLYPRILMDSDAKKDDKKEDDSDGKIVKGIKNAIGSFMGDGGVSINIPFNKMYSIGVDLDDASNEKDSDGNNTQAGRQLASFFSTFSHYGYIETVSGNSLAASAEGGVSSFFRFLAGLVLIVTLIVYQFFNTLLGYIVAFIGKLDFFSLLGYNDPEQMRKNADNPFTKAIYGFIQGMGISPAVFHLFVLIGFYIIVAIFAFRMMRTLSNRAFHMGQMGDHTRRLIVRFLVFFPIPALVISLIGGFAGQLTEIQNSNKFNPTPAQQYIINDRKWAASQNLSPTALNANKVPPNVGSEKQHIDGGYAPSSSRNLISDINYESYSRMEGYKDKNSMKMSLDLISGFMSNNTFNVNTYMADIRQTPPSGQSVTDLYAAYQNTDTLSEKVNSKTYEDYIWTAKPVSSSNADEAKPTYKNFKSNSVAGVDGGQDNGSSFSTQSVALMLQTSFENHAANFYAYNIPPQGLQGQAKNLSTVKTEWREYSLPGEGPIGKFGSFLALVSQSLFQAFIIAACIHALIFTNFFKSLVLAVKHWFWAAGSGSPIHMVIFTILALTSPLTGFIAYVLPSLFVAAINTLASGINGAVNALGIQNVDGVIDIGKSLTFLFLSVYLIITKTVTGKNIITTIIDFPTAVGLDLSKKAAQIMRSRQRIRDGIRLAGDSMRKTGQTSQASMAAGMTGDTFRHGGQVLRNPADWSRYGAAYLRNQQVGNNGNSNANGQPNNAGYDDGYGQTARDFASDLAKGGNGYGTAGSSGAAFAGGAVGSAASGAAASNVTGAKTGRIGTAPNTLLGQRNPSTMYNQNANPYGNRDYFGNYAPTGSPANLIHNRRVQRGQDGENENSSVENPENRELNNNLKNNAAILPSAMKNGTAKDFADKLKEEQAKQEAEAKRNGEKQGREDVNRALQGDKEFNSKEPTAKDIASGYSDSNNSQYSDSMDVSSGHSNVGNNKVNSGETAKEFASNEPLFNDHEVKSLKEARDESDFQEKLYFTRNGQYTALSQDSAKQQLAGTEFVNNDGDIDYGKVDEFNDDINGKHLDELNDLRMRQKEQIDFAFRQGASSIYKDYQNIDEVHDDKGNNK